MTLMNRVIPVLTILVSHFVTASPAEAQLTSPQSPTDWDLYMLRLVNRARTDPYEENILHGTNYDVAATNPLAYSTLLGRVAQNHTEWMSANRANPAINNPSSQNAPDSFSHYETLNGQRHGPTGASQSTGWSGDDIGQRTSYVGYQWQRAGENILWKSFPPPIRAELIEANHLGWWNSPGHRSNLMNPGYTEFGHFLLNDSDGADRDHWATQSFGTLYRSPTTHVFGLVFTDTDENGGWTPRSFDDPLHEGLGGVSVELKRTADDVIVGSTTTLDNGSYALNVESGMYDLVFRDESLPGRQRTISGIVVDGANVDAGDFLADLTDVLPVLQPGDSNQDLRFDQFDIIRVLTGGKYRTSQPATWGDGDWDGAPGGSPGDPPMGDGLFNQFDLVAAQQAGLYNTGAYAAEARRSIPVPEPSTVVLLLSAIAWCVQGRTVRCKRAGQRHFVACDNP